MDNRRAKILAGILSEDETPNADKINDAVIELFTNNPQPSETQVHALAKKMGVSTSVLEEEVFKLFGALLKKLGKHHTSPDSDFDAEQLAMGVKVEMEHTDHPSISKMIAKDHLKEIPDYYSRLGKMEKDAGSKDAVTSPDDLANAPVGENVIATFTNFENWWRKATSLGAKLRIRSSDNTKFFAADSSKRHSIGFWDRTKDEGEVFGVRQILRHSEIMAEDLELLAIE